MPAEHKDISGESHIHRQTASPRWEAEGQHGDSPCADCPFCPFGFWTVYTYHLVGKGIKTLTKSIQIKRVMQHV